MACLVPTAGRSPLRLIVLACAVLLLVAPATAVAGPEIEPAEGDLLARINAVRSGQPPVRTHPQIAAAAHAQAAWLSGLSGAQRDALTAQVAHCGGPGCPDDRATAAGWPDARTIMGEITKLGATAGAAPQALNDDAIAAWRRSEGHSRQLYASGWAYAGIGIVGDITVVVFAQPCTVGGCTPGGGTGALLPALAPGGFGPGAPARTGTAPAGTGTAPAGTGADPASTTRTPARQRRCAARGRVRVVRRGKRRVGVEVRMSCRQPGRRYRVRVRDGRRRRVVALRRERAVVPVRTSRRSRWVRVDVDEGRRRLGSVRVRVRGR